MSADTLQATLQGHTRAVFGVALSVDGRLPASGGLDGTVRLCEPSSGAALRILLSDRRYERLDITGLTCVDPLDAGSFRPRRDSQVASGSDSFQRIASRTLATRNPAT